MRTVAIVLCLVILASCTSGGEGHPEAGPVERRALAERPACGNIDQQLRRVRRGWVPVRAVDISLLPREPNYIGPRAKPVHTGPFDFLADVPLVLYGPGHIDPIGEVDRPATMADVSPTIARMVGFDDYRAPDGDALTEAFSGSDPPRLVLTVVWDGGGWNTLDEHPSRWPFLERLTREGASYTDFEIGSTPSNTPPIHTTLGTGAFPRHHGIPAVKMETSSGDYIDPYEGNDADLVRIPTLGDLYDRALDNEPLVGLVATVNWHLGMIGHGASFRGGDRDLALLMNDQGEPYGNPGVYEVPSGAPGSLTGVADSLDARDGARDGAWEGRDLGDPAVRYGSPAYVTYQAQVLTSVIASEGFGADGIPDLLFTNFKSLDDAGHRWGMTSEEAGEVLGATDSALETVVRSLDRTVGVGEWVVIVTADHGQNVYPEESGAWPISGGELKRDANEALDATDDGRDLVTRVTSAGAFVDAEQMDVNRLSLRRIARWMASYRVSENVRPGGRLPREWRDRADEPLFDAAVPGNGAPILTCAP